MDVSSSPEMSRAGAVDEVRRRVRELRRLSHQEAVAEAAEARGRATQSPVEWSALSADAVFRAFGIELHDGQLTAGLAMSAGVTVQMRTGEGKTFAAIGAAAFHAASDKRVHVVTANSYLAARDEDWSGRVLRALGFTTAATLPGMTRDQALAGYEADIVFGSGNDFGFDFLRDGLCLPGDRAVQRGLDVAIVDEADAVLLDEARTPLVLSGPAPANVAAIRRAEDVCRTLRVGVDVTLDEKHRNVELTDDGVRRAEAALGVGNLYSGSGIDWPQLLHNALRARAMLRRDHDYIVAGGRVLPVDERTGRVVEGRSWSDGLHQAVEAKERVPITAERRTMGRITVAGYFQEYSTLIGMSGTLEGAESELADVYGMVCTTVPTHKPIVRTDHTDAQWVDRGAKLEGVAADVLRRHSVGQPVLIGTTSIEASHAFSDVLTELGVPHRTLSAINDAEEATVIAQAGQKGAVTVATQMAGRGVDILLGGAGSEPGKREEIVQLGGLMVWGLDHHPAPRLDMQLRGRAGRQGDPGESRFASSPDDELAALATSEAAPPATLAGQLVAEQLDRTRRADVRLYETVTDRLQGHLYDWRRRVRDEMDVDKSLADAASLIGLRVARGRPWPLPTARPPIPWWKSKQRLLAEHLVASLANRRADIGEPLFSQAARLLLSTLLVVLWPDQLETLEAKKALSRLGPAFANRVPSWRSAAVASYDDFVTGVTEEWVRQLLAFRVLDEPVTTTSNERDEVPLLPSASAEAAQSETPLLGEWHGWSFNRFVREHFGAEIEDPPVVLTVDSIGDAPTAYGLQLHLDLEDPGATSVIRTEREGARRNDSGGL